jgi:hypothetical protein
MLVLCLNRGRLLVYPMMKYTALSVVMAIMFFLMMTYSIDSIPTGMEFLCVSNSCNIL